MKYSYVMSHGGISLSRGGAYVGRDVLPWQLRYLINYTGGRVGRLWNVIKELDLFWNVKGL